MKKFTLKKFSKAGKEERAKMFRDHKMLITELNCVHYCGIGGHLWYHSPAGKNGIPNCEYRCIDGGVSTIRFFRICPKHFRRERSSFSDFADDFEE